MDQKSAEILRSLVLFKEPLLNVESATMLAPAPAPPPRADRTPLDDLLAGRPGRLGPCRAGLAQRDETADSRDGGSSAKERAMKEVNYVFGALEEPDVEALMRIGTHQQLHVSDALLTEGTHHDAIYLVLHGELSVSVKGRNAAIAHGRGRRAF